MGSYVPNTKEQRQEMLKEIGFQTIDDLFAHIPAEVKIQGGLNIPEGKTELEVRRDMENIAAKNQVFKTIFPRRRRLPAFYSGNSKERDFKRKFINCIYSLSGRDQPGNPAVDL